MLLALFLVCAVSLALSTFTLLAVGHRLRIASRVLGVLSAAGIALLSGWLSRWLWHLSSPHAVGGEVLVFVLCFTVVVARRDWNPVGQVFYGSLVAASLVYLAFGLYVTFGTGLSAVGMAASGLLFLLEAGALTLSGSFAFEACDVTCRVQWPREIPAPDPAYRPFVSLQIAAYNEPPDMLLDTIRSCEAIDYPSFEVVVIDNNTRDPAVWGPVEEYCRDRPRVRFVHVEEWPGYKAGALNLALREHTDPRAEVIGVVDADYQIDPAYLTSLVGYFADPSVAFVQTPQDYRDFEGDTYLRACYDAYRFFFAATMPSRNQRNSIIFAGTMGLIRRDALVQQGGWNEWCITEDSEASLRLLRRGLQGIYVSRTFGRGVMPLTFSALKSQRFRWCFGGMQILRMHWRDLLPWSRSPDNQLSVGQRIDYLLGGVEWLNDLLYLGFTGTLVASVAVILLSGHLALRPLLGLSVLLPASLIASGLLRALWALRVHTGIGIRRATLAFLNWLSLSWTVSIACVQGLLRSEGVFLRTPKAAEGHSVWAAVGAVRMEVVLTLVLWTGAVVMVLHPGTAPLLVALLAWQGFVYASAPVMSWLNSRTVLSPALERRRRTEWMRERLGSAAPYMVGAAAALAVVAVIGGVIGFGGSHPGTHVRNPFVLPRQPAGQPSPSISVSPSPSPTPTASITPTPSVSASSSPPPSPSPSPTVTASPSPSVTPAPTPS